MRHSHTDTACHNISGRYFQLVPYSRGAQLSGHTPRRLSGTASSLDGNCHYDAGIRPLGWFAIYTSTQLSIVTFKTTSITVHKLRTCADETDHVAQPCLASHVRSMGEWEFPHAAGLESSRFDVE
jgi:hypothetical protein